MAFYYAHRLIIWLILMLAIAIWMIFVLLYLHETASELRAIHALMLKDPKESHSYPD